MNYYLGIDTSCYTTSLALLDETGKIHADLRKILQVKSGGRGLSQSEMVFQHTRNLPDLFEELTTSLQRQLASVVAVGVSAYPRPQPDSYMPAFLVGTGYARVVAGLLDAALVNLSHQENHIGSGLRSAGGPYGQEFLALHLSGGTTEIVNVNLTDIQNAQITILGETEDLHAGQFIDRVGVALGLSFPAGPELESLALASTSPLKIPFTVRNLNVSFSGPETHVQRLIANGNPPADIAAGTLKCIASAVSCILREASLQTGLTEILVVGGVSENIYIRNFLLQSLANEKIKLFFTEPSYSRDNATGAAFWAQRRTQFPPPAHNIK